MRIHEATKQMDDSLLSGLFAKQGLRALPVPSALQAEVTAAAFDARKQVDKLVPPGTIERIAGWIVEYRNAHKNEKR